MKPQALVVINCMDMNEEKQMVLQKLPRDILPFTTTWIMMNFEGIMLSEISQTKKDKYYVISFIYRF